LGLLLHSNIRWYSIISGFILEPRNFLYWTPCGGSINRGWRSEKHVIMLKTVLWIHALCTLSLFHSIIQLTFLDIFLVNSKGLLKHWWLPLDIERGAFIFAFDFSSATLSTALIRWTSDYRKLFFFCIVENIVLVLFVCEGSDNFLIAVLDWTSFRYGKVFIHSIGGLYHLISESSIFACFWFRRHLAQFIKLIINFHSLIKTFLSSHILLLVWWF